MADRDKTFDEIMESITSGFIGEWESDRKRLKESMEEYKDHPLSKEILRACGRLMWEMVPDDLRAKLEQTMGNHQIATESTLDEVAYNLKMGNPAKALELVEPLAKKLDELAASGWCADDSESRYFDFDSAIDEMVWRAHNDERRDIRSATGPFARVYLTYGSCLYELERHLEAIEACSKAIRWNPADVNLRFELAENYKRLHDMDAYERILQELYPYIASADELAHYHRAMGYLRIEQQHFKTAAAHLMASLLFEESSLPLGEVMFIKMEHGQDYTDMTLQEAVSVLDSAGEPLLIDHATFDAMDQLLRMALQHGDLHTALQVAVELYNFTKSEECERIVRELIDAMKEVDEES